MVDSTYFEDVLKKVPESVISTKSNILEQLSSTAAPSRQGVAHLLTELQSCSVSSPAHGYLKRAGFHAASTLNQLQIHYWHLLTAGRYFRNFYVVALKIMVINFHLAQTWSLPHQYSSIRWPSDAAPMSWRPQAHHMTWWYYTIFRYSCIHDYIMINYILIVHVFHAIVFVNTLIYSNYIHLYHVYACMMHIHGQTLSKKC